MALLSLQILYTFVLRVEIATIFGPNVVAISARNTKLINYTKFANFARLYFPHFTTKLCNFTHFSMLFLAVRAAVVIYLHLLA
jgi:hypothetical protein